MFYFVATTIFFLFAILARECLSLFHFAVKSLLHAYQPSFLAELDNAKRERPDKLDQWLQQKRNNALSSAKRDPEEKLDISRHLDQALALVNAQNNMDPEKSRTKFGSRGGRTDGSAATTK